MIVLLPSKKTSLEDFEQSMHLTSLTLDQKPRLEERRSVSPQIQNDFRVRSKGPLNQIGDDDAFTKCGFLWNDWGKRLVY